MSVSRPFGVSYFSEWPGTRSMEPPNDFETGDHLLHFLDEMEQHNSAIIIPPERSVGMFRVLGSPVRIPA